MSGDSISAMNVMNLNSVPPDVNKITSVVCQICKKSGHDASKCFFRFNNSSGQNNQSFSGDFRSNRSRGRFHSGRIRGGRGTGANSSRFSSDSWNPNSTGAYYATNANGMQSGFGTPMDRSGTAEYAIQRPGTPMDRAGTSVGEQSGFRHDRFSSRYQGVRSGHGGSASYHNGPDSFEPNSSYNPFCEKKFHTNGPDFGANHFAQWTD